METNDKLIRQSSALSPTGTSSLTLQETVLLSELDLTATNAKVALEPRIGKEFLRVLSNFPAEAIECAFRGWRDVSPFFPAISEIRELCMHWVRRQAEIKADEARAKEREQVEAARERGELINFAEMKAKLAEIAKHTQMPESRRMRFNAAVTTQEIPPAIPMTKQQIDARRAKELEEIQRYATENE